MNHVILTIEPDKSFAHEAVDYSAFIVKIFNVH